MSSATVGSSIATETTANNNITPNKKGVQFATPLSSEQLYYDGVKEEERDDVWFRRMDYVEFVENELRRRELLNAIEKGEKAKGKNGKTLRRRASDTTTEAEEEDLTHHFSRKMVSRSFSAGPKVTRRRKLPGRERNELDVSNHKEKKEKIGSMRRKFRNAKTQPQSETTTAGTETATADGDGDGEANAATTAAVDGEKDNKKEDPKQPKADTATSNEGNDTSGSKNEPEPAIEGGTSPTQALAV